MDFGLAREVDSNTQTSTGGVEGTPAFMAPEQARGETRLLDRRTDVYGLGATLYSVLAGRPPFVGNSTDVLLAVLLEDPPRLRALDPATPPALETIVHKCLDKDPKRRYESAQALADDLWRFLNGDPIEARPPGALRRLGRFVQRHKMIVASAFTALLASLILGGVALRIRWQAAAQARLAQRLGQEITKMEWLLRSARQLPLHDLNREKVLVRARMAALQSDLAAYGTVGQPLAHYALGRGHMALHEYPQALTELQKANAMGLQTPDLHYALGIVLGKHFEQAMYEARLSGGGDWAKKQLKQFEPKFLTPAIDSLQKSRAVQLDAPEYLEALISYYQRDYERALSLSQSALKTAPWLYEASKLAGDVHLDRALRARDSGKYEEAEKEFAASVKEYEAAAAIGQSDAEVYECLAESWVRQVEMARNKAQNADVPYKHAVLVAQKIIDTEPLIVSGYLKKMYSSIVSVNFSGAESHDKQMRLVDECVKYAEHALKIEPSNPFVVDAAANCYVDLAVMASISGADPVPLWNKAIGLLAPVMANNENFLWGQNDLGIIYSDYGAYLTRRGDAGAWQKLDSALRCYDNAAKIDDGYVNAFQNALSVISVIIGMIGDDEMLRKMETNAAAYFSVCIQKNYEYQQCYDNYFIVHALLAYRLSLSGQSPDASLTVAFENLAKTRALGGALLDAEQHAALAHWVQAEYGVGKGEDPAGALAEMAKDLANCLKIAPQDAMCRTLAAQADWVRADWLARAGKPTLPVLEAALAKAKLATQSKEIYPDAWQVLAETELRLARALSKRPTLRDPHLAAGLDAVRRTFAVNPNHALAHATQGEIQLLLAQQASDAVNRRRLAGEAKQALERAKQKDAFLSWRVEPSLATAASLLQ